MKKLFILSISFCALPPTIAQTGKVGINTSSPQAMLHVKDSSIVFTGFSPLLNENVTANPPVSGPGSRMMWYADKAAFRVGYVDDNRWDKSQIGRYSFAAGHSVLASGPFSAAIGLGAEAYGTNSIALGSASTEADYSFAIGISARTTFNNSVSIGTTTRAAAQYATAMGAFTVSNAYNCFVAGRYNDSVSTNFLSIFQWIDTDPLFIIGNGSGNNTRRNAMTVLKNGKTGINTSAPLAMLHVKDSSVVFTAPSTLPTTPGDPPVSGSGNRMMWYADRAAFRAGRAIGTDWDKDNLGYYSVAMGESTIADGFRGTAFGYNTRAQGTNSTAIGSTTRASGTGSTSMGGGTIANAYVSLAIGFYNDSLVAPETPLSSTIPLFMIGNGDDNDNRSNAMVVLKNGNTGIGENAPDVSLQLNGGIAYNGASYSANTATTNITVGNRTYIRISSNDSDPANRKVTLSNGLTIGQMLIIQCTGNGFRIEDADANIELQIALPTMNFGTDDTLSLIWDGGEWVELHRSDN